MDSTLDYGSRGKGSNPFEVTMVRCWVRIPPPELITGRSIRGYAGHEFFKNENNGKE